MTKTQVATATGQGVVYHGKYSKLVPYDRVQKPKKKVSKTSGDNVYLNMMQRGLYRRLMYGLKDYTPDQIACISPASLQKLMDDFRRTKRVLHVMKAKIYYAPHTRLINALLPKDVAFEKIGERDYDWFLDLPKTVTLKSLGITTKEVIDELISRKLLPKNFWDITNDNINL